MNRYQFLIFAALGLLVLSACNSNLQGEAALDGVTTPTQVVVRILDLDAVIPPKISPTTKIPTPSKLPTLTSTASQQSTTSSPTKVAPSPTCTNRAEFIKHLTVSDNTVLKAGESFAKVWQVKNSGSCIWGIEYVLLFLSGDKMDGSYENPFPELVAPGETVDLRVNLIAPSEPGTFTGNWVLSEPGGVIFGIGELGEDPLKIVIQVKPAPRATPG